MFQFTPPVNRLIEELKKMPGIGQKSAQRIVFFLLRTDRNIALNLANSIIDAREKIRLCSVCFNITTIDPCEICTDSKRETGKICVVEEPFNIYSIEKTDLFKGLYHVLHGNLSPIRGIGPEELKISSLLNRIQDSRIEEIILATSPTTEGNATAHYLTDRIRPYGKKVTRIALGLPVGADLDYVDSITIAKALEGRIEV